MTTINNAAGTGGRPEELNNGDNADPRKSLGLYLHIPFCIKKCNYCDFLSFSTADENQQELYIKALLRELEFYSEGYRNRYSVDTVFIGGGTPSLLDMDLMKDLVHTLKDRFVLAEDVEVTIESNPKTLDRRKLTGYFDMGINRLSIGAQSFHNGLLGRLGRSHSAEDFFENYYLARESGFENINIDLMFSIPGQTMESWRETLEKAMDLAPEHLSFYGLQIEEGTEFYRMRKEGLLLEIDDELDREMYHYTLKRLKDHGYLHYEISNAAKAGYGCRHNIRYWSMEDYLGLGLGAHSFAEGVRFSNETDLALYIRAGEDRPDFKPSQISKDGGGVVLSPFAVWQHVNSREENIAEHLFTGLRKIEGVDLSDFQKRFGETLTDVYAQNWHEIQNYVDEEFLILSDNRMRFTEKGIDISNTILTEFI